MAAAFSPIPAYVLGTACCGRGLMGLIAPRDEYSHVGLPLEATASRSLDSNPSSIDPKQEEEPLPESEQHDDDDDDDDNNNGYASPLIYFKGIREITYGAALVALQLQGQERALTTFAAILSLARLGDGLVVWKHGGEALRWKAWGHWITGVGFLGWVACRKRF
ncbi:hypothetical protein GGR56DRAFT_650121 [Xylariaceae sp. FL0804]|nr:hypothetical protein GGR56DRAFT_650121 [Xylariaceae sp. FL0804]